MQPSPIRPLKVALVTNMVAPYRVSFYNALARHCDFTVIVDAENEFNRSWKIAESEFLFHRVVMNSRSLVLPRVRKDVGYREYRQFHFSQQVYFRLRQLAPEVVISSELGLRSLWSRLYARAHGIPWLLASEATEHTEGWVGAAKRGFRRWLIGGADGFWSNGRATDEFLTRRGAVPADITSGMTGIDTVGFQQAALEVMGNRDALRAELGVSGVVFLFVGRFEAGKGMRELQAVLMRLAPSLAGRASFLWVGDGTMCAEFKNAVGGMPGVPHVFCGFVQPAELPRYFALADVFLMPTLDDNWPLVNLEALAAGLPQLYSVFNGGAVDVNRVAGIGAAIDPRDLECFARRVAGCVDEMPPRISVAASRELLDFHSPEAQAGRAMESIRMAIKRCSRAR